MHTAHSYPVVSDGEGGLSNPQDANPLDADPPNADPLDADLP